MHFAQVAGRGAGRGVETPGRTTAAGPDQKQSQIGVCVAESD